MPQLLKKAQLAHQHSVSQVQIGGSGVKAGFYAQWPSGFAAIFKAFAQVAHADDFLRALLEQVHLFVYWQKLAHLVFQYKVALGNTRLGPSPRSARVLP
jgi:hypothetical protein